MILMDFPYVFSLANASKTILVNIPKMSHFIIFYRKQGASERNLHYAQLDHSTKKHAKLH